jgi:hypothetical protein
MNTPKTIKEAVETLKSKLKPNDLSRIAKMKKTDLISLHHGLGRWIRNNFGLWAGNKELIKDVTDNAQVKPLSPHVDSISFSIIQELWREIK